MGDEIEIVVKQLQATIPEPSVLIKEEQVTLSIELEQPRIEARFVGKPVEMQFPSSPIIYQEGLLTKYHEILNDETSKLVTHGLNRMVHVTLIDEGGFESEATVEHVDLNTVQLGFQPAFSGIAYFA